MHLNFYQYLLLNEHNLPTKKKNLFKIQEFKLFEVSFYIEKQAKYFVSPSHYMLQSKNSLTPYNVSLFCLYIIDYQRRKWNALNNDLRVVELSKGIKRTFTFGELILVNSSMQLLWHTESETVFGPQYKSSPLKDLVLENNW